MSSADLYHRGKNKTNKANKQVALQAVLFHTPMKDKNTRVNVLLYQYGIVWTHTDSKGINKRILLRDSVNKHWLEVY